MGSLWTAYRALTGLKAAAVNGGIILVILSALYGWHKWQVYSAFNEGKQAAIAAARVEAGKRIIEMEKRDDTFKSKSARDRCIAFLRDSGLPVGKNCDP